MEGTFDDIAEIAWERSILTFESEDEKRQVEHLQRLFALGAQMPRLEPLIRQLVKLPPQQTLGFCPVVVSCKKMGRGCVRAACNLRLPIAPTHPNFPRLFEKIPVVGAQAAQGIRDQSAGASDQDEPGGVVERGADVPGDTVVGGGLVDWWMRIEPCSRRVESHAGCFD